MLLGYPSYIKRLEYFLFAKIFSTKSLIISSETNEPFFRILFISLPKDVFFSDSALNNSPADILNKLKFLIKNPSFP